jgi:hypothetical protein
MGKPKNANLDSIGYEPDPVLAVSQIKELAQSMNRVRIRTAPTSRPEAVRYISLELTDKQIELRRLVEQWKESGPNLRKLFKQRPELVLMTRNGYTTFWPTGSGRGHLEWVAKPSTNGVLDPLEEAVQEFMMLIANPEWRRLGGPCARCGDYYWKERLNQKYIAVANAPPSIRR